MNRQFLARESLPIVVCSAFVGMVAVLVPRLLAADGWLALVGGRLIASHGLPHHDTLAALTAGRAWIDQQWLGQLGIYALEAVGGIRLVLVVNVLLVACAFVGACVFARRRDAQPTTVAIVALLALLPFLVTAMNVRTQSFAYVPFVAVVGLLSRRRLTTSLVVAVLTMLVVWANVHGSALLAAGVIALRGAVEIVSHRRERPQRRLAWALLLVPWPCLVASPYHLHLLGYYAKTALNPSFSSYLSQWAPTTFSPISAPLLLLLLATLWLLGRAAGIYTAYERCVLVLAVFLGLTAVRNWAFAALLLMMLTPAGFDRALRKREPRQAPPVGAAVAVVAAVAAAAGLVGALSASTSTLTKGYPRQAGDAAARAAAGRDAAVYAGISFADWLLWSHPELAGKVVLDARYELLHTAEVKRLVLFDSGSEVGAPLGAPTAYVLDPSTEKYAVNGLRIDVRTLYNTDQAFVAVVRHER